MRGLEDEAKSPKYAHLELERRWLVDADSRPRLEGLSYIVIEDRYIDDSRMRLRKMTDGITGQSVVKLTKKYDCADPLARPIVTAYLTDTEYSLLKSMPAQKLNKRRYAVESDGISWSLDQFEGDLIGLELLEIEWPDYDGLCKLSPPDWTVTEVSHDIRYQGGTLIKLGIPEN